MDPIDQQTASDQDNIDFSFEETSAAASVPISSRRKDVIQENGLATLETESSPVWERTLRRVIPAIVSIRSICVRSFDTDSQRTSQATGFVVDAEQGLILSNRHVVQAAPTLAEAIFTESKEEIKLIPIYRDPVHDFGLYKFNPASIRYMRVVDIPLVPEQARVGLDIRVLGNDNGERLSILAGTLARLDRKAPSYGAGKYNDWNTFYYQAASMTSGGSSGSPVINQDGNAIALNAGGSTGAASSFFLPLDRVVRALKLIQEGKPVLRGTIQTIFVCTNYDEVKRLGLDNETEYEFRTGFPDASGMLVVTQVLPNGPADGLLEPGDVLVTVNKEKIVSFAKLEGIWDDLVGQSIEMEVIRGPERKIVTLIVQDLHSITPDRFLEVGGGTVHQLSYQMAKSFHVPVSGVFVSNPGYMLGLAGISRKCIIESVNNFPTPTLAAFIEVINSLKDNQRVPTRFYHLADINKHRIAIVQVDRHWHGYKVAQRNDRTGLWDYEELPACIGEADIPPHTATSLVLDDALGPAKSVISALIHVEFRMPFKVDGVMYQVHSGIGVVLDAKKGFVLADRNTIPTSIGDVLLTFANSVTIPGRLVYLHQVFNYAIIAYDVSLLGDTVVQAAVLSDTPLKQGDTVYAVCLKSAQPIVRKTIVANVRQFFVSEPIPPTYRTMNVEGIELENSVSHGGLLTTVDGVVQGFQLAYTKHGSKHRSEFHMGMSAEHVKPVLQALQSENPEKLKMNGLDVELTYTQIAHARVLGLSDEWVKKIESCDSTRRNVLVVRRVTSDTPSFSLLETGDLLLAINSTPATTFHDVTKRIYDAELDLTILRDSKEMDIKVPLSPLLTSGTERIVGWAGAIFQMSHKPIYQHLKKVPDGVLCCVVCDGSPAQLYGLSPLTWVIAINERPIKDLNDFLAVVSSVPTDTFVRVKVVNFSRMVKVITIRTNAHYFGCWELVKDEKSTSGWILSSK